MTIIKTIQARGGLVPTTTAHQARLRIFQPTRRPVMLEQVMNTAWGRIRVNGRLGQQHADVLEAMMYSGTRPKELHDDRIKLLVDPAEVRRRARQDGTTFKRVLDDLLQALVEIQQPERLAGTGHLIDNVDYAQRPGGTYVTAPNPLGGERRLWRVDLGKALCKLIESDLWQHRDPRAIAQLRHGISQAVARHVLSHKDCTCTRWGVDTLIRAVSGEISAQSLRDRRRELREDAELLAEIGVRVDQNRDGVEQNRDGVEQNRDVWSKTAMPSGISGSSGA